MDNDARDHYTPLPQAIWATEVQCVGRHERTCEVLAELRDSIRSIERHLVALVGCDGGNGKVGAILERCSDHERRMRRSETVLTVLLVIVVGGGGLAAVVTTALRMAGGT